MSPAQIIELLKQMVGSQNLEKVLDWADREPWFSVNSYEEIMDLVEEIWGPYQDQKQMILLDSVDFVEGSIIARNSR